MKRFLYYSLCFSTLACKFSPTGTYVKEIAQVPDSQLQINLKEYRNKSDIYVWGVVTFTLQLSPARPLYDSFAIFGNDTLRNTGAVSEFHVDSRAYVDGEYPFSVYVLVNSGTGSLADQAGLEGAVFRQDWRLHVDNAPPDSINVLSITPSGDAITVTWEQYERLNFQQYVVLRNTTGTFQPMATITDPSKTTWIDKTYIGGDVSYRVEVTGSDQKVDGASFPFSGDSTRFTAFETTPENKVKLLWQTCPYPLAFEKYEVYRNDRRKVEITDINVTEWLDEESGFGSAFEYSIRTISASHQTNHDTTVWIGNKIPAYYNLNYVESLNSLYLSHLGVIYRLNTSSFAILDSILTKNLYVYTRQTHYAFDISPNGLYAYGTAHSKIYRLDPLSLEVMQMYDTGDFVPYENSVPVSLTVTDDHRLIYEGEIVWYVSPTLHVEQDSIIVLDMNSGRLLTKQPYQDFVRVSNDGTFYTTSDYLYQLNEFWSRQVGRIQNNYFAFVDGGSTCVTTENNTVIVRNSADLSIIADLSDGRQYFKPVIDQMSGLMGGYDLSSHIYSIKDLNTGALVHQESIEPAGPYAIFDHRLMVGTGYFLELEY